MQMRPRPGLNSSWSMPSFAVPESDMAGRVGKMHVECKDTLATSEVAGLRVGALFEVGGPEGGEQKTLHVFGFSVEMAQ